MRGGWFGIVLMALLAVPALAVAQTPARIPRIGMLLSGTPPPPGQPHPLLDAFRSGLRDLGYVEGRNLLVEYRWSERREPRMAEHAAELVRLGVAVIVAAGTPETRAAKAATSSIPIVMTSVGDPVGAGLVASLARPGGNVTGFSLLDTDLDGKRLELLREARG